MKANRVTIIHGNIDVAPDARGLEACLINFAFVDKMRYGFLRNIAEFFPDTQVNIKAAGDVEADDISVILDQGCDSAEELFDKAYSEYAYSETLRGVYKANYALWLDESVESARFKLKRLPKDWFKLFAAVPREKHLAVLGILLSKPQTGISEKAHKKWIAEAIEGVLEED